MNLLIAIIDAVALILCAAAAVIDLRCYRIPNRLTFAGIAGGLALNLTFGVLCDGPAGGAHWLLSALAGAVFGLVVFGLPGALSLVGMGDVKLIIAVGALIRWPLALPLALYVALAGGAIALVLAARGGRGRVVIRNVMSLGTNSGAVLHRMPYGLAIAIGCAWAVAARHIEALRLVG